MKNGFKNYHGSDLLEHYHEAAYDAYMTGYVFAKVLKYKEVDDLYHQNKKKGDKKDRRKKKDKEEDKDAKKDEPEEKEEFKEVPASPHSVKNKPVNIDHSFYKTYKNKVMLN